MIRRRDVIVLLGGAAAAWPVAARAQQGERMPRIGVLMSAADDREGQARLAAFLEGLQKLGWTVGRNVHLDLRWGAGDAADIRKYAAELVTLKPEVLLAPGSSTVGPLLHATNALPIVFVHLLDPVGGGFVASLARPGGNATGFSQFEFGMSTKWVELLKEIAPRVLRAAVLRDPLLTSGVGQFGAVQGAASSIGMELTPVGVRDVGEMERAIAALVTSPNGSLIVTANPLAVVHRELIVRVAAHHQLPANYFERFFVV